MPKHLRVLLSALISLTATATEMAKVHYPGPDGIELTALWQAQDHPAPVVIVLHGCVGLYDKHGEVAAKHVAMATFLRRQGYAVLMPDSFGPRGRTEVCTEKISQRHVTVSQRADDVLAARRWLDQQADAKPGQVALLGWSNGGSTVLRTMGKSAASGRFSAAAAFYPGCESSVGKVKQLAAPTLILTGEADDWTAIAPCRQLAAELGPEYLQLQAYPDTYHDFDNPALLHTRHRADVPNGVHPGAGVTIAPNPAAAVDAWQRAADWFKVSFARPVKAH